MNIFKKHFTTFLILVVFIGSFSLAAAAHQKNYDSTAGVTPSSPAYFIDSFFEDVRLFFAFDDEVRALLHVDFSLERLSEIEALLSKEDISEESIEKAKDKIKNHIDQITILLTEMKNNGMEVGSLAKRIDKGFDKILSEFDSGIDLLVSDMESEIEELKERAKSDSESIIKNSGNNFNDIKKLADRIGFVEIQAQLARDYVRNAEFAVEVFMLDKNRIKREVEESKIDFEELRSEADEEDLELPSGFFMTSNYFDSLERIESYLDNLEFSKASSSIEEVKHSVEALKSTVMEAKENKVMRYKSDINIIEAENSFKLKDEIPLDLKNSYTRFISQAKAEFEAGNYTEALNLAKQAKEVLISK